MVMRSRLCVTFNPNQPQSLPPHHHRERTLNFTVMIWQPFLDSKNLVESNQTLICGPMLSLLMQIARLMKANLTYVPDSNDHLIDQGLVQILLYPIHPYLMANRSRLYRLSTQLSESPMVSILSAQYPLPDGISLHSFSSTINLRFVGYYFVSWVLINLLSYALSHHDYLHQRFGSNLFRILLHQPAIGQWFNSRSRLALLTLNFIVLTFFFNQVISNSFLNLFTIKTKWDQINQVRDLVRRPHLKLCTFENEVATKLFQYLAKNRTIYQNFQGRMLVPEKSMMKVENYHQWEKWAINEVALDRMAIIADRPYLNFMWIHYRRRFNLTSLHRSSSKQYIQPNFLAFRWTGSSESILLEESINQVVSRMVESGIFRFWIRRTIYMNERHSWEKNPEENDHSPEEEEEEEDPNKEQDSIESEPDFYFWSKENGKKPGPGEFRQRIYESFSPLSYQDFQLLFTVYHWLNRVALLLLAMEVLYCRTGNIPYRIKLMVTGTTPT